MSEQDDLPPDWFDDTDDNLGQRQQFEWTNIMQGYAEKLAKAGLDASPALWEQFYKHLDSYQHINDPDIAVVLSVDAIKNRVYTAIEGGELDITSSPVTIKQISDIVEDQIKRSPRPKQSWGIISMKEPQRCDQWCDIIKAAVEEFEVEMRFTPNKDELWRRLIKTRPKGWMIEYNGRSRSLVNESGKPLEWEGFSKRFDRYFCQ